MPLTKINKALYGFIALFSMVGFVDATYLTIEHFRNVIPSCTVIRGCDNVLTSSYAGIGPIPTALLGSLYYLTILVLAVLYIDVQNIKIARLLKLFSWAGLVASAFFVYLQLFVLHHICLYCMVSASTSTIIFILARFIKYAPPAALVGTPDNLVSPD